jgi:hypothetical protein
MRRMLAGSSLSWVAPLLDLLHSLRRLVTYPQEEGLYEFLVYDATLELLDVKGQTAVFRKHQQVKFLQNNIAFEDVAWGDGDIFARYQVAPGVVADRYREGDRWTVLISLRETKQRGDVQDFHIERRVRNGFTKAEEWQQAEIRHRTRYFRLAVIFPKARPCRAATIRLRRHRQTIPLGPACFQHLPDGRQMVRWTTRNVTPLEIFTLGWGPGHMKGYTFGKKFLATTAPGQDSD